MKATTSISERMSRLFTVRPGEHEVDLRDREADDGKPRQAEDLLRGLLVSLEPLAPMELRLLEALGCTLADTVPPVSAGSTHAAELFDYQRELGDHASPSLSLETDGVLPAGLRLTPAHLALLASRGYERVMARPRPRVVVLSLLNETVEEKGGVGLPDTDSDADSEALEITDPDINGYLLAAAAHEAGGVSFRAGWVRAVPAKLLAAVEDQLLRADVVLIAGATEDGVRSLVAAELGRLGWVGYTEVALDPGGVQGLGRIGTDGIPVFLLPGDPVSAYVSFEAFARPVIRHLLGEQQVRRRTIEAICQRRLSVRPDACTYVPARIEDVDSADALPVVTPLTHALATPVEELAGANGLIMVPDGVEEVAVGTPVLVALLES